MADCCQIQLKTIIIVHYTKAAIKCLYESLRSFMEQQEGKEDYVESQAKHRKYRS